MKDSADTNFDRIENAIRYITTHFREQPDLDEVAKKIHLSPFHFQRIFSEWAGVSPKKFLQYLSLEHAKKMLQNTGTSLADAAFETGLSGTGRLHDLFVNIEGMTPGEYKNGGENLRINFSFAESPFGRLLIASTPKGICHISFTNGKEDDATALTDRFPNAQFSQVVDMMQQNALFIFSHNIIQLNSIKLHLKATPFQLKVWEALLKIPLGGLSTYGTIAQKIGHEKASRAVGTAIGDNPVAYIIPCHRVIQSTGAIGQYHWETNRKAAMIAWEAAKGGGE